jgi:hypothetical protein
VHFYLGISLVWQNNDPNAAYTVVETCTNGVNWFHTADDVHSGTTSLVVKKVPEGAYYQFRVFCVEGVAPPQIASAPSAVLAVWGEQAPGAISIFVNSTNQVTLSWKNNSVEDGFLLECATNASFTGAVTTTSVGPSVPQATVFATNFGFAFNVSYYWRVTATNAQGHATQPSAVASSTPNALPGAPAYWQAYNSSAGVALIWVPGGGMVDRWFIDVSANDTNHFVNIFNTPGGSPSYNWTDTGENPGSVLYFRLSASNAVGTVATAPQMVAVPQNIGASVWYVDSQATGNNVGTNWANAFPNFGSIAWANIQPGALIWIAPGNYNETVYVGASGTSNAPITFKLATTNSPRSGRVRLTAIVNGSHPYVRWDGAKSDAFSFSSLEAITNNIGIQLYGSTNVARGIYTTPRGTRIKWVEITGPYVNAAEFGEGSVAGIYFAGGVLGDTEVGYCWIHDMTADNRSGADGIDINADSGGDVWGAANVHHTIIERVRDNFIAGGGGIDIHDNILRDWAGGTPSAGHPDGIQNGAGYWRIYNNVIRDTPGACLYPEVVLTNTWGVLIYNNVIYGTGKLTNQFGLVYPGSGITWSTEPNLPFVIPTMTVSNVLIANNTFYGFDGNYLSVTRRATECGNLVLSGWTIVNNLVYTHNAGSQFGGGYSGDDGSIGMNYTTSDILLDWNDVCGLNNLVGWRGVNYTTTGLQSVGFTHNFSRLPVFADLASFDFHLLNQTNLVGTNLSAWASVAPGIDRNLDGTVRSITGWPVGALSGNQGAGMVLWLSFNGWDGTSSVTDASGNGNNAQLFGSSANYPTPVAGPLGLGAAAIDDNQYFGVTQPSGFSALTNGSVAVWARYNPSSYGNSLILDAGYDGETNSWRLGRVDGNLQTFFTVYDPTNGTRMYKIQFPDTGLTNWNHYAVTWDGNNIVGYFNGAPIATASQTAPFLRLGSLYNWMAIGTMHHEGTPQWGDDAYPNCCYLKGGVADIRIYNRSLSPLEMQGIFLGNGSLPGSSGGTTSIPAPQGLKVVPGG